MVAHDVASLLTTVTECVLHAGSSGGRYTCPYCHLGHLSEDELWRHVPAFHVNWPADVPVAPECPICSKRLSTCPLQVHIHEDHGPVARSYRAATRGHQPTAGKLYTQLYNFSLVVCRHPRTGKFLLCQEFSNQGFWLPGGAVDGGETLTTAAVRETKEEAGLDVHLKGILAVEYNPCGRISREDNDYLVRLRVVFYAEPAPESLDASPKRSVMCGVRACVCVFPHTPPVFVNPDSTSVPPCFPTRDSIPDYESAGAAWCSLEQLERIKLRGPEPLQWARYLHNGGAIYPLDMLKERVG
jgi:8-oxo-dGTP pyrophosphatase MutT (NUDIX family)